MNNIQIVPLLIALVVPQVAGGIGALFTSSAIRTWYNTLQRPDFAPPNWVFGPVWTTLFILMGIASYIVWSAGWERSDVRVALIAFGIQLVLNVLWSVLFFGARNPGGALIEIIVLWIAIGATIFLFWRVSTTAALLLVPYILWVSFASFLNYSFWRLN